MLVSNFFLNYGTPSTTFYMKFVFASNGEPFFIRKLPAVNIIEVRLIGKKIHYERTESGLKKLTDTVDERENTIVELINQYYIPTSKHNRHKPKS